ncbi:MAG: NADP-dependent succinate-semialdehyde dehydrogenase [Henriciella sp.]
MKANKMDSLIAKLEDAKLFRDLAYINGVWTDDGVEARQSVIDPATEKVFAKVPMLGASSAHKAIDAAKESLPSWRDKTAAERGAILMRLFDLIKDNAQDLAKIMTAECGKPLSQSVAEVAYGASFVEWFAEEGKRVYGETIPATQADRRLIVIKQPVGVTAAITPWNFPFACVLRKVAPALAAGCTQVLKPAPETPFSALAIAYLAAKAGVPAGVFSVITGDAPAIGQVLTSHEAVRVVSFTGSTPVGKLLAKQCAEHVKRPALELGGNAPFIVFEDADIEDCVSELILSKFRNTGQTCVCANRIIVHESIFEAFSDALASRISKMQVGPGAEDLDFGPMINRAGYDKVVRHVTDAFEKGARAIVGGKPHALGGLYYEPTVLTDLDPSMIIANEETFGPVAPLFSFRTEEEALEMANNTSSGLAAYIYTKDYRRMFRVCEALETGMVGVNAGVISNAVAPFGGVKESGIGREGSRHGMDDFLDLKYLHLKL